MSKRLTKRQRLCRDPANQRRQKLIAWAKRHAHLVEALMFPGLIDPRPRIVWRNAKG